MGLGRLLTRSTVYNATDTVTGASAVYTVVNGLVPDWPTYAYQGAMGIPGAWRASILLSDLLGEVPWDAYRKGEHGVPVEIQPCPLLLEQPAPPDTRMATFSSWGLDLIWHGNALGVIGARNAAGWPTGVIPVPACNVSVRRITPFADSPLPVGAIEYKIGSLTLSSDEVIHIKGPCEPGAVRGLGVLETQLNTINLARDQQRQASSVSVHGVPTGILKSINPNFSEKEALELKASWLRSQTQRSIAVLNADTEFTPLSWNPEQMQLVEARKFSLTELELIFGLPVGWLGGQTSSRQYSNIEQDSINLLKFTMGGHLARFEQTLSLAFPRGTTVKADLEYLLRSDTLSRYQSYAIGIGAGGILTPDEARALENRPPLTPLQRDQIAAMAPQKPAATNQDGRPEAPGTPGAPARRPLHAVPTRNPGSSSSARGR